MSKKPLVTVVVAAVIALGGSIWLSHRLRAPLVAESGEAGERALVQAKASLESSNAVEAGFSPAARESSRNPEQVEAALRPSPASAKEAPGLEVLVTSKESGDPVPGAEIDYAECKKDGERTLFTDWLRDGELETQLERRGRTHFMADEQGRARVTSPGPAHYAILVGKSGDSWGYAMLSDRSESPIRLVLVPDSDVDVYVVDERERPVAGARVTLRARSWQFDDHLAAVTGSEGTARLRHVGHQIAQWPGTHRTTWFVALGAAFEKPIEVAIEAARLPKEPVRLVLPRSGECEVRVLDPAGAPYKEPVEVSLAVLASDASLSFEPRDQDFAASAQLPNQSGVALFPHVEPGRVLEVAVNRLGSYHHHLHRARGFGPAVPGQRAVITVRLGDSASMLAGRVLDENGGILANTTLRSYIKDGEDELEYGRELKSDSEGRFLLDTSTGEWEPLQPTLTISTMDDRGAQHRAATKPFPAKLGAGVHHLGDFVLTPSPLLLAGIVLDSTNASIQNARILPVRKVFWEDSSAPGAFDWEHMSGLECTSDASGKFEIRGHFRGNEVGVWARKEGLVGEGVFTTGSSDVEIRMTATGEIAGLVLLDASIPPGMLSIQVGLEEDSSSLAPWIPSVALDAQGRFTVKDLKAGQFTLWLTNMNTGRRLRSVEGVSVEGGATTRDPRLNPLDLRTSLRSFRLKIVDSDGTPIPSGRLLSRPPSEPSTEIHHSVFQNGSALLFHSGSGLDVTVSADGFYDHGLLAVSTDQQIVLKRSPPLRFRLAQGLSAPEAPLYLGVRLEPLEVSGPRRTWHGEIKASGELAKKATAIGRLRVVLTLTLRDENMWKRAELKDGVERVIEVADQAEEQVFEIAFDPSTLAQQAEELRNSKE